MLYSVFTEKLSYSHPRRSSRAVMIVKRLACLKPLAAAPAVLQISFTFLIGVIVVIRRAAVFSRAVMVVEFLTGFKPLAAVIAVLHIPFAFLIGIIIIIRTVIIYRETFCTFPDLEIFV